MRLAVGLCSLLLLPFDASSGELKRLSLDEPTSLGLTIESDPVVKVEGKGSIKISTVWPTTVCLGEISALDVENATLVYQASVKSELDGVAFLEMWAHVAGGRYFSRGLNDVIKGTSGWTSIQTPFLFRKGQKPDKVTLNLVIQGTGTVWIDAAVLTTETPR